jgi:carbamoyltransferase
MHCRCNGDGCRARRKFRARLESEPAGEFFDRTIRPQLVNEMNAGYRDVIRAFKARTGVGGILNTSFNLHGYPIVGSPEVALDTLKKSELDAVALGPFLVSPRVSQLLVRENASAASK